MRFQKFIRAVYDLLVFAACLACFYGVKVAFTEWFGTNLWVTIFTDIIGILLDLVIVTLWYGSTEDSIVEDINYNERKKYEKLYYSKRTECDKLREKLAKANAAKTGRDYEELYNEYFCEVLRLEQLLREHGIQISEQE